MKGIILGSYAVILSAIPAMVFAGRRTLELRHWFIALWLWIGAASVVLTTIADMTQSNLEVQAMVRVASLLSNTVFILFSGLIVLGFAGRWLISHAYRSKS